MAEDDRWGDISYLKGGTHRWDVFVRLASGGPAIPSELADSLDKHPSRVSDALSELEERDLVVLVAPEDQKKGRLRKVTDHGEKVWGLLQEQEMV
ncbi:MAG: ArsR family transcriptional regulator [Halorientalis sp.]